MPIDDEGPPAKASMKADVMGENERYVQKIREEFAKFERTMEELHFLKQVADDLKSYRQMIRVKKYD